MDRFAQHCYMHDEDLENPLAFPYFGDCTGFSPVFLGVSTEEVLFDDSIRMHEKLLKEGVDSRLVVWEYVMFVIARCLHKHCFMRKSSAEMR